MLEPLHPDESSELIGNLAGPVGLPASLRSRVADAAEGNPLFVEEFVAMLRDENLLDSPASDLSSLAVPSSIQALISSRLDRLEIPARDVIGRASVIGKAFEAPALRALMSENDRGRVADQLRILVRRELVRPNPNAADGDHYRFRHILVRDVAYGALPKELRADLHERCASWLESTSADRLSELEEIIGYHLAQAHAYRTELGMVDAETWSLAERAIAHLEAAARRARDRGDAPAAGDLFNRAVALAPLGDPRRAEWLLEVAWGARLAIDLVASERACLRMREEAEAAGNEQLLALADMTLQALQVRRDPAVAVADLEGAAAKVEAAVHQGASDLVAAVYWITLGEASLGVCRWREAVERNRRALEAAQRLGHATLEREARQQMVNAMAFGPFPSEEVAREIAGMRGELGPSYLVAAVPLAQQGRIAEARRVVAEGRAAAEELELRWLAVHSHFYGGYAELAAGDLPNAERALRVAVEKLGAAGETGVFSTAAGTLACVQGWVGRFDEAVENAERSRTATAVDDISSQALWRMAMAIVATSRGDIGVAERHAREAVGITTPTDFLDLRGDAHRVLGDVLEAGGRIDDARAERREALRHYEAKQVLSKIAALRALTD
jgi:tetratricopeptide (TPR) repeat protein